MATERRAERIFQVLSRRQPDLTVIAEDVHKPHNLSAMIRSCDAVGIGVVHATGTTGEVPTYSATSASAEKWVELVVHDDLDLTLDGVQAAGMQVLAAHLGPSAIDYRDADYTVPTAILFGNERDGVSARASARADAHVTIPMLGMVRSLNVSVATAVILFEAQRQRREAGMYDRPALGEHERNELAFRWLHPHAAARLDAAGRTYPRIDERGEPTEAP